MIIRTFTTGLVSGVAIAGCVVMGLLIAPAVATAEWLPAVDISEESEFNVHQEPQVAVDASGGAVAVWPQLQGHYLTQASTKLAGGTWEPAVDISPAAENAIQPGVAMNSAGQALAVWINLSSQRVVEAAGRTPQGNWEAADQISIPGYSATDLDVAIDPAGNAVAVWTQYDETSDYIVEAAVRSPAGEWEPAVELSEAGNNAWEPKAAIDPAGNVVVAWYRWNDDGDTIVQVAEKKPGQDWSEPKDLSAGGAKARSPEIVVSAGRAVVAWERAEVVEASARKSGGAWQPPVEVSGPGSRAPAVGIDQEGNALAIWSSGPELSLRNAEVASLPLGGSWTTPIILSERLPAEGGQPQVAVDPVGRAMAVWTAWDGTAPIIESASGTVAGGWSSPITISPQDAWARHAQVAMDGAGNAAAVWKAYEPSTMQAALFDITKPELGPVSIPPAARAGRPVSFAASPFDAWSLLNPVTWTFGDGSVATGSSVIHSFKEAGQFEATVTATDAAGHSTTASGPVKVSPALAISDRVVIVKNGRAHLKLRCPGTADCRGRARLTPWRVLKKIRKYPRLIGTARVVVPAETRMTVMIKLNPKALKPLRAFHRHSLRARLAGDAVESRIVILKPVAPKPKAHR